MSNCTHVGIVRNIESNSPENSQCLPPAHSIQGTRWDISCSESVSECALSCEKLELLIIYGVVLSAFSIGFYKGFAVTSLTVWVSTQTNFDNFALLNLC